MPVTYTEWVQSQGKDLPLLLKADQCTGKTFIVTGANTGIGYECARHLVSSQSARVILAVRDLNKGKAAKASIEAETKRQDVVDVQKLDLTSFDSVKSFASKMESGADRIDAVIANAAVSNGSWLEAEGVEMCLTVNILSNFLLMALLAPQIKAKRSSAESIPSFTFVGSIGTFLSPKPLLADVNRNDIFKDMNDRSKWDSRLEDRYITTKLLLHMAVRELATLTTPSQSGVIINVADPGMCKTGLNHRVALMTRFRAWAANLLLGRTAEMGSRAILAGIALGEESHGKFIADCEIADTKISNWVTEEEGKVWQRRIWEEIAEKLEHISPGCLTWLSHN